MALVASIGLFGHQADFLQAPATYTGMVGGYGSGKTFALGSKALMLAVENAGLPGMVAAPTHRMAKDIVKPTLEDILNRAGVKFRYAKSDAKFYLQNGSEIWLRSAENPDSLKGPNLAWVLLDEADMMSRDAWVVSVSRARHPKAPRFCVGLSTTAEGLGWIHGVFNVENAGNPAYKLFTGISTRANKALPPSYLDALLANMSPDQVAAYVDGLMQAPIEHRVIHAFNREKHLVDCPVEKGALLGVGMDFNVHPATATLYQRYGAAECVVDYWTLPSSSTLELGQIIAGQYGTGLPLAIDHTGHNREHATGNSDANILRGLSFTIKSAPTKSVKDKWNHLNVALKNAKGETGLYVARQCVARKHKEFPSVVECLENAQYDSRHIDLKDKSLGHLLDGMAYRRINFHPIKRPTTPVASNFYSP